MAIFLSVVFFFSFIRVQAQEVETIKLSDPNKTGGLPVMEALSIRASVRGWSESELSSQDLSDLLWAANGINRSDKKRTASSAQNAQDIDIYVFMKQGVYLYDAGNHALNLVASGDQRSKIAMPLPSGAKPPAAPSGEGGPAPINLALVSDISRFRSGTQEGRLEWAAIDVGIVSQNISLFCAAKRMGTRPRASIGKDNLRTLLKLKETQYPLLEHPIGYLVAAK
jgi:SagB-type dehydrogenase family enzyme